MTVLRHFFSTAALTLFVCAPAAIASNNNQVKVFITAEQPSVAEFVYLQRTARNIDPTRQQQTTYTAGLVREQEDLARRMSPFIVKEHSRLRVALNGFRASVERQHIETLRSLPGIKSVTPIRHHELANIDSVPWVQAPELWESLGDGKGITIAVIDTGIDYLHANFGGAGNPDDYINNDFAVLEAGTFPTPKVIGGWDFAGPTYNSREDDDPLPDPDPLDGHGHGSHVSGTAAGHGVEGYIGPGVARGANLMALKVFSDIGGSTDLTVDAIEYALDPNGDGSMDDHVDVINMSLGARFGLPTDPSAVATSHAVRAGVIVVASAGNNGTIPYVTGSPGVSPEAITVAASISGGRRQIALSTNLEDAPLMAALEGAGPVKFSPDVLQAGVVAALGSDPAQGVSTACEPLSNASEVDGRAVIVVRGECQFPEKYQHVQDAGGVAIVVKNTSDSVGSLLIMGGIYPEDINIPGLMITSTDGQRLLDAVAENDSTLVEFSSTFLVPTPTDLDDVIATFSSQGPGASGAGYKPDLAAPGRFTVSTLAGSGVQGVQRRGTSMAAPHVAGMAALLKQQYPDFAPASIKALLQNSGEPSQQDGPGTDSPARVSRQGNGVIRGARASSLTSLIEPAGVSFGYLNVLTTKHAKRTLTLRNLAESERTFVARQEEVTSQAGIAVECPEQVTVEPLGTAEVSVRLRADADLLASDDGRMSRVETSGWCVFSDGRDELRVGYVAGADGASKAVITQPDTRSVDVQNRVKASAVPVQPENTSSGKPGLGNTARPVAQNAQIANQGVHRALAHSFVLVAEADQDQSGNIVAFGWRNAELFTQPVFELGIALKETWDHPSNYRYFLRMDTDGDDEIERTLFAVDWSQLGFDPGTIVTGLDYIEDLNDVGTDNSVSHWLAEDVDFNDRVIVLPWFNAESGVNALFKPSERNLRVTLIVLDRYGNESSLSGTINLDNPAASDQGVHVLSSGAGTQVNPGADGQLWLVPTNIAKDQVKIANGSELQNEQAAPETSVPVVLPPVTVAKD